MPSTDFPKCLLVAALVVSLFVVQDVRGDRIARHKIYYELQSKYFCIRRLNATHQVGCQSLHSGNVGVLHEINSQFDVEFITKSSNIAKFIAVVTPESFTYTNLRRFRNSGNVVGVLLLYSQSDKRIDSFSPEAKCPNDQFSFYSRNQTEFAHCSGSGNWNEEGMDMLREDWSFPIFLINSAVDIREIHECLKHNNYTDDGPSWPLCSAELTSLMYSARDANLCLNRMYGNFILNTKPTLPFCGAISGFNLFAPLFYNISTFDAPLGIRSIIIISARLDANSMFMNFAPAADTTVTAITVLLATAETLSRFRDKIDNPTRNVLFTLFDGESFDYIGSSRAAYDLKYGRLQSNITFDRPVLNITDISMRSIHSIIDLAQLAPHGNRTVFVHTDKVTRQDNDINTQVLEIIEKLKNSTTEETQVSLIDPPKNMPPSAVQSFLREQPLPGLLITNHAGRFVNRFYNSFLDDQHNIQYDSSTINHLTDISTILSRTLIKMMSETQVPKEEITASNETVSQLLSCFLINTTCSLFQFVFPKANLATPEGFLQELTTSSISTSNNHLVTIHLLQKLLAYFTGQVVNITDMDSCSQANPNGRFVNDWMSETNGTGTCYQSQRFSTYAISPAFTDDELINSLGDNYPTWTQSSYGSFGARIFLKPSPAHERLLFSLGCVIQILSFGIVYFVRSKSFIFDAGNSEVNLV